MKNNIPVNISNKKVLLKKIESAISKGTRTKTFFYFNIGSFYYRSNPLYSEALEKSDYCYLNSFYIGLVYRLISGKNLNKINAEDFLFELLDSCRIKKYRVLLMGSRSGISRKAVSNLKIKFPGLRINGISGYFNDDGTVIKKINGYAPQVMIVGLGPDYQETWVHKNLSAFSKIKAIVAVGNFIDVLGEARNISPPWVRNLELEWLYRLVKEPKRLWRRYLYGVAIFIRETILSLLR